MNDTTTMSGDHLRTLTPLEARYKAALEEIREVARLMHGRGKGLVSLVDKALK